MHTRCLHAKSSRLEGIIYSTIELNVENMSCDQENTWDDNRLFVFCGVTHNVC